MLVPNIGVHHSGPLSYPIFWEFLGATVISITYGVVAFISLSPARIFAWNLHLFVRAGGKLLSGATEDDRWSFAEDVLDPENMERLLFYARAWERAENHAIHVEFERLRAEGKELQIHGRPPISAFYLFSHRRELERASYAATFLQMISDHEFCSVAVRRHPWPLATMLKEISHRRSHAEAANQFIQQIAAQAIIQDGSLMAKEIRVGGFSSASLLSESLFDDLFILGSYNVLYGLQFDMPDNPTEGFLERLNSASKMILKTAIRHHEFWPQGYMHQVEGVYERLSRMVSFSRAKGQQIDAAFRLQIGIKDLSHIMQLALDKLEWQTQKGLFVNDPDPTRSRSDLVEIIASIVFVSFESIATDFKGVEDTAWIHVISTFMDIYPSHPEGPDGMTPLQQKLALKFLEKVRDNMNGWYPAITRVLLAVVGPYERPGVEKKNSAIELFRAAFYRELRKLPKLHAEKPEKVANFLPNNVTYDREKNTLTHTYAGGDVAVTKLSELDVAEIDLCDENSWRKPAPVQVGVRA